MQQWPLRKAGFIGLLLLGAGLFVASCVDEPTIAPQPQMMSTIRFVNGIPDATIDIWIDNEKVVSNLPYKNVIDSTVKPWIVDFTYRKIHAGNRFLRVTVAGEDTSQSLFRALLTLPSLTQNTYVFFNTRASQRVSLVRTTERFTYADETVKLKGKPDKDGNVVDSAAVKIINAIPGLLNAKLNEGPNFVIVIPGTPTQSGQEPVSAYKNIAARAYEFNFVAGRAFVIDTTVQPLTRYTFIAFGANTLTADYAMLVDNDVPDLDRY